MKTTKQLIEKAYDALHILDQKSGTNHRQELRDLCCGEERSHRGFARDFALYHPDAPSVGFIARLFAVKRIATYLDGEEMPNGARYLHCQKSIFYAAGLVDEFRSDIERAWDGLDIKALADLNYTDFVKVVTPATI